MKPNSPEWLAWLEQVNPQQATMTRTMLQAAGREDVCSICGDEQSADYRLATDASLTLRLCEDCRGARRRMHGETFVRLVEA